MLPTLGQHQPSTFENSPTIVLTLSPIYPILFTKIILILRWSKVWKVCSIIILIVVSRACIHQGECEWRLPRPCPGPGLAGAGACAIWTQNNEGRESDSRTQGHTTTASQHPGRNQLTPCPGARGGARPGSKRARQQWATRGRQSVRQLLLSSTQRTEHIQPAQYSYPQHQCKQRRHVANVALARRVMKTWWPGWTLVTSAQPQSAVIKAPFGLHQTGLSYITRRPPQTTYQHQHGIDIKTAYPTIHTKEVNTIYTLKRLS